MTTYGKDQGDRPDAPETLKEIIYDLDRHLDRDDYIQDYFISRQFPDEEFPDYTINTIKKEIHLKRPERDKSIDRQEIGIGDLFSRRALFLVAPPQGVDVSKEVANRAAGLAQVELNLKYKADVAPLLTRTIGHVSVIKFIQNAKTNDSPVRVSLPLMLSESPVLGAPEVLIPAHSDVLVYSTQGLSPVEQAQQAVSQALAKITRASS